MAPILSLVPLALLLLVAAALFLGRGTRLSRGVQRGCTGLLVIWGGLLTIIALIRAILIVAAWASGRPAGRDAAGVLTAVGVLAAIFVGVVLVAYLRVFLRFHDRDVAASLKRANEGDLDGAIAELRAVIESKGPSARRSNGLGVLYLLRNSLGEALVSFDEAVRLGKRHPLFLGNQGLALQKLGRAEEAVDSLTEAIAREASSVPLYVNRCLALIDLGRLDEARADLERAEALGRQAITLGGKATREAIALQTQQWIDDCRARLAAKAPDKKDDLVGLDEL